MYAGRYQLGDKLSVLVVTKTAAGVPTLPDACPRMSIADGSGAVAVDELQWTGIGALFTTDKLLGAGFTTGAHLATVTYEISGVTQAQQIEFLILPGGNSGGFVGSAYNHEFGPDTYTLFESAAGTLSSMKNPESV